MSKTAIRLFFNFVTPAALSHIDCGTSNPKLKGTVRLNTFTNLTAFNGGDNDLQSVTGFSQLTALKRFEIVGANTVHFNVSSLPVNLDYLDIRGLNTTFGDIATLPVNLINYTNTGQNTTSGQISALPNSLLFYENFGSNTTQGDIGGLKEGLRTFTNNGANKTLGDIGTLPSSLLIYSNNGDNETQGDIGTLPSNLTSYTNRGLNTTTGNLSTLPSSIVRYDNRGNNTVYNYYDGHSTNYGQKVWAQSQDLWVLSPALSDGVPGMPHTHLATLLVDLSGITWTGNKSFRADINNPTLSSNQPYWSKVEAAINALQSQGVTVAVLTAQV